MKRIIFPLLLVFLASCQEEKTTNDNKKITTGIQSSTTDKKQNSNPNSFEIDGTCESGRNEAYADLMKYGFKLIDVGYADRSDNYWKLAGERYGIYLKYRAGCCSSEAM